MAKLILANAFVSVNGVDLSDHLKQITLQTSAAMVDVTAMNSAGVLARLGGLKDWSLSLQFLQDFAASEVDATLFPLVGTSFAVIVRPVNTAKGATNPEFTGTGIMQDYTPLGETVGDAAMAPCTILGNGALTRATS